MNYTQKLIYLKRSKQYVLQTRSLVNGNMVVKDLDNKTAKKLILKGMKVEKR